MSPWFTVALQTFGLKNKNKSKKVQAFVAQVSKQVFEGGTRKTVSHNNPQRPCVPLHVSGPQSVFIGVPNVVLGAENDTGRAGCRGAS